jgi:hypothetical protein
MIELKIDRSQLDYLIMIIEQNLEVDEENNDPLHIRMLHNLYSQLIILTNEK